MKNSERILDEERSKSFGRPIFKPDPDCRNCEGTGEVHGVLCDALNCGGHTVICVCMEKNWDVEKQDWRDE